MDWNKIMEDLFNDIRKWNRDWKVFESYKYSSIRDPNEIIPDMPKTADDFILELNKKYTVIKK